MIISTDIAVFGVVAVLMVLRMPSFLLLPQPQPTQQLSTAGCWLV
jgi:hypothetical protein